MEPAHAVFAGNKTESVAALGVDEIQSTGDAPDGGVLEDQPRERRLAAGRMGGRGRGGGRTCPPPVLSPILLIPSHSLWGGGGATTGPSPLGG